VVVAVALAVSAGRVLFADIDNGPILYTFSANHGIDGSDLLTIPFLLLVGGFVWPRRSAR
jgi:hypothetical protein